MENSLGNPARGDAFYDRKKEIDKIYKVLKGGSSIYLSAPRRVGKTSILKYLEETPREGYHFIYIITESVDDKNEFFKIVFEELIKSDTIKKLAKISNAIREFMSGLAGRVKSISDVELREGEETDYYELLAELFSKVTIESGRLVVMIDEFPQTLLNILENDEKGKENAQLLLQKNRELRHHKNVLDKINFIYTGSVSLFPMVEKVTHSLL
jgi:AAA+ ATPase superfamily predicted ATPase